MSGKRGVGSLLDLLPRPHTPEWEQLPTFVKEEVKLLLKGYRPLKQGEIDEHNLLPKRIEHLGHEVKGLVSKVEDLRTGLVDLGDKLLSPVEHMLAEFRAFALRLTLLEEDRKKHEGRLDDHDLEIHEHHTRIVAVERAIKKQTTKRTTRGKKKP